MRINEAWNKKLSRRESGESNMLKTLLSKNIGNIRGRDVRLERQNSAGSGDNDEGIGNDLELGGGEGMEECSIDCSAGLGHNES